MLEAKEKEYLTRRHRGLGDRSPDKKRRGQGGKRKYRLKDKGFLDKTKETYVNYTPTTIDNITRKGGALGVKIKLINDSYQEELQKWESLDEDARTAWLRRVFANNLLDEIRRFRAQSRDVSREQSLEQAMEQSASRLNDWLVTQQSSPSQKAIRSEQAVRLATALGCLTSPQREAIEFHHLKGMPLAEVGTRMNRDKGAVAALIFRGTKRLRELLGEESENE